MHRSVDDSLHTPVVPASQTKRSIVMFIRRILCLSQFLNTGFARRAAFVRVHRNLIGITQTVDTIMHAISKYNKLNNLSCVSNCKAPQDRQKTCILTESAPQGRRKPISRPRMGVGSMVGGWVRALGCRELSGRCLGCRASPMPNPYGGLLVKPCLVPKS